MYSVISKNISKQKSPTFMVTVANTVLSCLFKVKSCDEASLLIMTSQGNIQLKLKNMDEVKVCTTFLSQLLSLHEGIQRLLTITLFFQIVFFLQTSFLHHLYCTAKTFTYFIYLFNNIFIYLCILILLLFMHKLTVYPLLIIYLNNCLIVLLMTFIHNVYFLLIVVY